MNEGILYHQQGKDPLYKIWHSSKEHLFMYIHSGTGSIVCSEGIFPIKKGALVFISADTYHYTVPDDPDAYDRSKLILSSQLFNKVSNLLENNSLFKYIYDKAIVYAEVDEKNDKAIESIFLDWDKKEDESTCEIQLLYSLLKLICFFNTPTLNSTLAPVGVMNCAIKYINENIANDINIDDICFAVNMSKYYFCRQFKEHIGLTVMKYILKTRIVLAKHELMKTNLSITEISNKYGFSSVSYFCRAFKDEEACTPLQYRKRSNI